METFFKYRSLKGENNWTRFKDILCKNQLFATKYIDMNDPMEGFFFHHGLSRTKLKNIMKGKTNFRICSLSRCSTDIGMWTHYADEGRGICIEVEPDLSSKWEIYNINYNKQLTDIEVLLENHTDYQTIKELLTSKLKWWEYEQETRLMTNVDNNKKSCFLPIKIKRIFIGYKSEKRQEPKIRQLVNEINATFTDRDKIKVERISLNDLTYYDYHTKRNFNI